MGVVGLFLVTRDRQIPLGAPDMAIRREQSGRNGRLQPNNTLRGEGKRSRTVEQRGNRGDREEREPDWG